MVSWAQTPKNDRDYMFKIINPQYSWKSRRDILGGAKIRRNS